MKDFFYVLKSESTPSETASLDGCYTYKLWKPSLRSVVPTGESALIFSVWFLMHSLRFFSNRDYAVFLICAGDTIVHRSVIVPRYFRFPFMAKGDLQIGDTWTHPEYRGQGFATFAIQKITEAFRKPGRTFWYVVEQENRASIRAVEKAGFELVGEGNRIKRFGIRALGAYVIQQPVTSHK